MATTLRDIATHLNLSAALVSRVLNNKPGVWASEETRQRVLDTAKAMNYRPSAMARALVTGRTMQIAVSAADSEWSLGRSGRTAEVRGLIDAAALHHYKVLVLPSPAHLADRHQFESLIQSDGCDGFCVYAEQGSPELYEFFTAHDTRFVVVGNPGNPSLPQVDQDNYRQMYDSIAWLVANGHERIAFVGPSTQKDQQTHVRVLNQGYTDAVNALAGGFDEKLRPARCHTREEILRFVSMPNAPTAVIVRGVSSTLNWKYTLLLNGYRIPEDFVILSHIDIAEMYHMQEGALQEGLACHVHDPRLVGAQAGEVLMQWINGNPPGPDPILISSLGIGWCEEFEVNSRPLQRG